MLIRLLGYDTSRTYPENSFPYAAPIYGSQPAAPTSTAAPIYHNTTQLNPMSYPSNQVRPAYEDQSGSYLNVGPTTAPEVTDYTPQKGTRDSKMYVYINSLYELATASAPLFFLMFGHRKCQALLQKQSQEGAACAYAVTADVPDFASTSCAAATVPLLLLMESAEGEVVAKIDVGDFTYLDSGLHSNGSPPHDGSRKRKISSDSAELMKSPAKRPSTQQLRPKEEYGNYGYPPADSTSTYSTYVQPSTQYGNQIVSQYARPASGYQAQASSRHLYGYSTSATASPPALKAQSPHLSNWNSGYPPVGSNLSRSPGVPSNIGISRPSLSSLPSPGLQANPPLIRTSTIQQTPSPATTPHGGHPGQHFNAYALYPHKAKLEIQGDLEAMAIHWSEEEFESRRRLVHFRRSQSGSTITTTFSPVSVDDRPPNSVCISCIFWEEKQECFVTSVDTIYLLEQLVAARFTVEEKNRIRRNLEGFRPLTVSKGKPESEEFFKVIMAFPAPKPRNIEKDVKVFHWKDLASALKKIIGKYVS
jgi:hypothetical protein